MTIVEWRQGEGGREGKEEKEAKRGKKKRQERIQKKEVLVLVRVKEGGVGSKMN